MAFRSISVILSVVATATSFAADARSRDEIERRHGLRLSAMTAQELAIVGTVTDRFAQEVGPLNRFKIQIEILAAKEGRKNWKGEVQADPVSRYGHSWRGITSPPSDIGILPLEILKADDEWRREKKVVPGGEEKLAYNFQWTLAHEIGHVLAFAVGIGDAFMGPSHAIPRALKALKESRWKDFLTEWLELHWAVSEEANKLGRSDRKDGRDVRPAGYPRRDHIFDDVGSGSVFESFADGIAYLVTDQTYAKEDKLLERKLDLIRKKFFAPLKAESSDK